MTATAADVTLAYLADRPRIRQTVATYIGAGLRAQSFDDRGGTRSFCFVHGDDVQSCHAHDRCAAHPASCDCRAKSPCQGEPVTAGDLTGEAAITADSFRALAADLDRWEQRLQAECGPYVHVARPATLPEVAWVLRDTRPYPRSLGPAARVFARALVLAADPAPPPKGHAHDGTPGCESCWRIRHANGERWWSEPTPQIAQPTDLGGMLARRWRLCEACYRRARTTGKLPTIGDLRHRLTDPRGHWPKSHVKSSA